MIIRTITDKEPLKTGAMKRNTAQKHVIEEIVCAACDHPSAEMIYYRAKEEIPNISLGTVYRVLTGFVNEGKVREVSVPDAPSRYDKTLRTHAHFICEKCKGVSDIDVKCDLLGIADNVDYTIKDADIVFRGLCPECKEEK